AHGVGARGTAGIFADLVVDFDRDERKRRSGQRDQDMSAQTRWSLPDLALEADDAAEQYCEQQPQDDDQLRKRGAKGIAGHDFSIPPPESSSGQRGGGTDVPDGCRDASAGGLPTLRSHAGKDELACASRPGVRFRVDMRYACMASRSRSV